MAIYFTETIITSKVAERENQHFGMNVCGCWNVRAFIIHIISVKIAHLIGF